jgi:hypothetical protein
MKTYTAGQLEAAFEFCRIVNERGGFRLSAEGRGEEEDVFYEFPDLTCLLNSPDDCEHLPLPPKKVMMQMWRSVSGYEVAHPAKTLVGYRTKIGEPFEFVYPEGD